MTMKPLYKTTIVIWSKFDPSHVGMENLAYEASEGQAYCSLRDTLVVDDPKADKDWDGTEFFDSPSNEE